jgi:DNA repair exonuclease SbcCD ATPase subunit
MNKIDGLWDGLKTADDIAAEIDRQVATSAELLGLPATQVYPVSAQKALVAKIRNDPALLERSRLPELEAALSRELIPGKQDLVRESTLGAVEDVVVQTTELLEARLAAIQDQIDELVHLRGKNRDVIGQMMAKANEDQQQFERGLAQFTAMRRLFAGQVAIVRADIGMETLRSQVHVTRVGMEKSLFTHGLREAMREFFRRLEHKLGHADEKIEEIHAMLGAMYRKFSEEHGLAAVNPPAHTLARYRTEMARLERIFNERFNTVFKLLTLEQHRLTAQFFETLAARVIDVFEVANRETEAWFKALIAPMETQVREHQAQLKRRVESVSRIHAATETLDERIGELEAAAQTVTDQLDELARLHGQIVAALSYVAANPPALARRA